MRHGGPDPTRARSAYDAGAPRYDVLTRALDGPRRRAVERLRLRPGETVLDMACGTGANFGRLLEGVGATGRVVGVDISPGMLGRARERIRRHEWQNVELLEGDVAILELPAADAVLFSFTHDVLQVPAAVGAAVGALRPGGRVAAVGVKWASRGAVNVAVRVASRRFVTTFDGLERPWRVLQTQCGSSLDWDDLWFGSLYVAAGSCGAPGRSDVH